MGSQSTKVVIVLGGQMLAAVTVRTRASAEDEALQAMTEAAQQARLKIDDVKAIVATGAGRAGVSLARATRSTASCIAKGAHFLFPAVRTVLDAGAESSTAIRVSADGAALGSAGNDKCAAGAGAFLDTMSHMLRIPVADLGAQSLGASAAEPISNTCAVFAESEVVSLVHKEPPVPIPNILAGINESMARRLFGIVQRVGVRPDVVMTGGVSKNVGIVQAMEARLGQSVFVPDDPLIVGALGAALFAREGLV